MTPHWTSEWRHGELTPRINEVIACVVLTGCRARGDLEAMVRARIPIGFWASFRPWLKGMNAAATRCDLGHRDDRRPPFASRASRVTTISARSRTTVGLDDGFAAAGYEGHAFNRPDQRGAGSAVGAAHWGSRWMKVRDPDGRTFVLAEVPKT